MTFYFYSPETKSAELTAAAHAVVGLLERAGVTVRTKESPTPPPASPADADTSPLDRVDAIIVEGTESDPEVGYLLAYAIAQKKPLLHLTRKGTNRHTPVETFGKKHRLPANILMLHYELRSMEKCIRIFFNKLDHLDFAEMPTIKFTLRITPQIERYLQWKTHNTALSKADFVRQILLKDVMAKDEAYMKFRRLSKKDAESEEEEEP